jgi:hypothetical protein
MPALFLSPTGALEPLWASRQISPAAEVSAMEKLMRPKFAIGHRQAKRPDFVFAALIVFVVLLIGLIRAIDLLTAHAGGIVG